MFLKGPGALIGHRGATRRPADATFMHYECELAVVIGKPARRVDARRRDGARRRLHDRQRLRDPRLPRELVPARTCASRTATARTALGPWLVDAADVDGAAAARAAHLRQRPADAAAATPAT